ncbi:MAG: hypothetical protein HC886_11045 [Leptolyngbyaceae cyanobacterium SM1_1_3]|nr:hypothetical protein [Leptolyngbyaceae cyanobacterium SM1_1_3]NJN02588.1 hypothetical protein [Leptolyngbyaceae cyanobacterium RM1_1_2]NJO08601.1 hypothetical protein [Leptolyngbyaceae cyanobacterium SL_1_1]
MRSSLLKRLGLRLRQMAPIAALGLLQIVLCLSAIAQPAIALDLNQLTNQNTSPFSPQSITAENLDAAADAVEQAAGDVYEGLETTKRIKGKTELRNQKIEEGRDHASDKLQELADKARAADSPDELSVPERRILQQYQKVN